MVVGPGSSTLWRYSPRTSQHTARPRIIPSVPTILQKVLVGILVATHLKSAPFACVCLRLKAYLPSDTRAIHWPTTGQSQAFPCTYIDRSSHFSHFVFRSPHGFLSQGFRCGPGGSLTTSPKVVFCGRWLKWQDPKT